MGEYIKEKTENARTTTTPVKKTKGQLGDLSHKIKNQRKIRIKKS